MEEKQDELARFYENVQKLQESVGRLTHAQQSQSQNVRTEVSGDQTPKWAIVAIAVAVAAIVVMYMKTDAARDVANAQIEAAEYKRATDMERMAELRGSVRELDQYKDQLLRRVGALENSKGECK